MAGPRLPLRDGRSLPQLGLGVWEVPRGETARVVAEGLGLGYRLVDGAAIYGNEREMGQGIRAAGLPCDEVFVTTKVWNDRQGDARAAVEESLGRIGLDRLDCVLIHWPAPWRGTYVRAWEALIALREEGVVSSVGVSNFDAGQIDRLVAATGVAPVLNQVECHPRLRQAPLRAAMAERGVVVQAWTPLGQGRAFDAVRPIAERLGKTPAQVVLRWQVEVGNAVIPRSVRAERLRENAAIFDFALSPEDHALIAGLDRGERCGPDPATFG